jgi:hypothetical protein
MKQFFKNILPNFSNIARSSGNSNCPICNTEDTNVHFIHCQKMDDNQDLLNLIQSFWNKFSNSNWINWDWILKGWINKSIVRSLDAREIKVYDQEKLKIVLSLQKRWNLRCSLIKKTSPARCYLYKMKIHLQTEYIQFYKFYT